MKHFDWMFKATWLYLANQSALFQSCIAKFVYWVPLNFFRDWNREREYNRRAQLSLRRRLCVESKGKIYGTGGGGRGGGQRARLLLWRSKFESRIRLQFYLKSFVWREKYKHTEVGVGPLKNWNIFYHTLVALLGTPMSVGPYPQPTASMASAWSFGSSLWISSPCRYQCFCLSAALNHRFQWFKITPLIRVLLNQRDLLVSAATDRKAILWLVGDDGSVQRQDLPVPGSESVSCVNWSADGSLLAMGNDIT